jgi:hypothetical protein
MSNTITTNLVFTSDGSVDRAPSTEAFTTALNARIAERETQISLIVEGVSSLFDQYKGESVGLPAVASMVAQRLNAPPASFKVISERVAQYVRDNSDGKGTNEYQIRKGKSGGVSRVSDQAVKA